MDARGQARMAVDLGYTQYETFADTGEAGSVPVAQCILPEQPFAVTGNRLIIRELAMLGNGRAKVARDGITFRFRIKMPITPR